MPHNCPNKHIVSKCLMADSTDKTYPLSQIQMSGDSPVMIQFRY